MEKSSLTAIAAGSAPDCAFAAGNNPRIDLTSIALADLAAAERAVGVADNGSIRRLERPFRHFERTGPSPSRNGGPIHRSRGRLCTLAAVSAADFTGSTRLSSTTAPGRSSLSPL
jgi:hypothetical protein